MQPDMFPSLFPKTENVIALPGHARDIADILDADASISDRQIAEQLGISRSLVNQTRRALVQAGVVHPGARRGGRPCGEPLPGWVPAIGATVYWFGLPAPEGQGAPVKVGFTNNMVSRIGGLRTSCPGGVVLAALAASKAVERELHEHLATHRQQLEWFDRRPALFAAHLWGAHIDAPAWPCRVTGDRGSFGGSTVTVRQGAAMISSTVCATDLGDAGHVGPCPSREAPTMTGHIQMRGAGIDDAECDAGEPLDLVCWNQ
jgi:hypothetical protein